MPIKDLLILGAGGHASVVLDALRCIDKNNHCQIEIRDDNTALQNHAIEDILINTPIGDISRTSIAIHIAIGNNRIREQLTELADNIQSFFTITHPAASIARHCNIEHGCFVAAQAVVGPNAKLGINTIVNHGAIVDHDCQIGAWCHIAPNATLGGNVTVGQGCLVGAGAVVLPGITIGDYAIIGAGAVVVSDVAAKTTVVGIPALPKV